MSVTHVVRNSVMTMRKNFTGKQNTVNTQRQSTLLLIPIYMCRTSSLSASEGHREYSDVYGKIYPHYLTGTTDVSSNIDRWLLQGRSFDIRNLHHDNSPYEFESTFTHEIDSRKYFKELEQSGKFKLEVELDGIVYKFYKTLSGASAQVVENHSGLDPWFRALKIQYRANTLENLLEEVNKKLTYWIHD